MKTTKDIIKLLPLKEDMKATLLQRFETLNPDQKYSVETLLWDMYFALYNTKLEENIAHAFEQAETDEVKFDQNFYPHLQKQTADEMERKYKKDMATVDLSEAREELQNLISPK